MLLKLQCRLGALSERQLFAPREAVASYASKVSASKDESEEDRFARSLAKQQAAEVLGQAKEAERKAALSRNRFAVLAE